ncbi:hypothetical protein [Kitasatospora sp. NPDC088783]|uniref:hypothetical protein n=1 Tax=Kitasatospora sp. NPDC088783 TaxID=3364077 RepID=UPI00380E1FCC
MANRDAAVLLRGFEYHCTSGGSDKFYRFIVYFGDHPGVLGLSGRRGAPDPATNYKPFDSIADAIKYVVGLARGKERKGYLLSRDYTLFEVPMAWAGEFTRAQYAGEVSHLFGLAAELAGHAHPDASRISAVPMPGQ